MRYFIYLLLFSSLSASAESSKNELQQTYEGNIRGIRALMADLHENQPEIFQKLNADFRDLDSRQSHADTIAYSAYGISAGLAIYGFAKCFGAFNSRDGNSGFTFTPFLLSLGTSLLGGLAYGLTRPSPQEYLDFTNKHNRLNKQRQLQWNLTLTPKSSALGVALNF